MAADNLSQIGLKIGGADATALFLKVFGGEVFDSYLKHTFTRDRLMYRAISNGKSATFPVIGRDTAKFHTPGESLLTNSGYDSSISHTERIVLIDKLMVATAMVDNLDELMNYYDVRAPYARQMGQALAVQQDKHALAAIARATTLTASTFADSTHPDGLEPVNVLSAATTRATASDTTDELYGLILELAQKFDDNDVPSEGRVLVLAPTEYWALLELTTNIVNSRYTRNINGGVDSGDVLRVAGFEIQKSTVWESLIGQNNTGIDQRNSYAFDGTKMIALGFHKEAAGTVYLKDLAVESEYLTEYQGTLLVAKQAQGTAIIRPECCGAISFT